MAATAIQTSRFLVRAMWTNEHHVKSTHLTFDTTMFGPKLLGLNRDGG